MRAWLALRAAGVPFVEEVVDIRRPQRFANLRAVAQVSVAGAVPVLVIDGEVVFDSLAIMEFANDWCGGALMPKERVARARARSVLAWQHAGLSGICKRISFESAFYPVKRALSAQEISECERLFGFLEGLLGGSDGEYLFGEVSLADLALVPTVVRLTRHAPELAPRLRVWVEALLGRAEVVEWLGEADALPHVWLDDYLLEGAPY